LTVSTTIIAYYRVSTARQGRSGLGLEAQRKAVTAYAAQNALTIAEEFTEVETGKGADALERRPVFAEALRKAKKLKATIAVAKLDRLSRDVAFISTLMSNKVDFVTVDDPTKSPFMLHIKAAVAQEERRLISQRTREALAEAKKRGRKLGNQRQADANKAAAAARDTQLEPVLDTMRKLPYREIAQKLNDRGIPSPRGGAWHATTVRRSMKRLGIAV
jgi:DNA invertase Pin-like site-specific DNA recombinase